MNNSFQHCISNICGLEISALAKGGKYTVFANSVVVVEGHGGIVDYTSQKITFVFGKSVLCVCGERLKIKCLEKHYAVVEGKICSVAVQNG